MENFRKALEILHKKGGNPIKALYRLNGFDSKTEWRYIRCPKFGDVWKIYKNGVLSPSWGDTKRFTDWDGKATLIHWNWDGVCLDQNGSEFETGAEILSMNEICIEFLAEGNPANKSPEYIAGNCWREEGDALVPYTMEEAIAFGGLAVNS